MDQILDRLWLGTVEDAAAFADPSTQAIPMTAILSLNEAAPTVHPSIAHIHAPIPDEVYLPMPTWTELLHTLTKLLHTRGTVLVHCRLGVSRSPALVAAYLVQCGHSRDPLAALAYVVSRRGCVRPHEETWRGVTEWFGQKERRV